ncbi:sensor histidine kinase [Hymenobacter ruricola]|uniref:Histidine kinase n=1 Tax=Hymenobacter ruricola TaxID=2791023 RepID=A0ABS0IC71_9BACT|nr:histidine kinase [Hymenobacter ruricola]MBF9224069.1 histidine kinase [Hymenobacter ruricola]
MLDFLRRHRVVLLHVSFWGLYFSWYVYQFRAEYSWLASVGYTGLSIVLYLPLVYFNYFGLLPRWLRHQRTGRYLLEFAAAFLPALALRVYVLWHFAPANVSPDYLYSPLYVLGLGVSMLFIAAFVSMLRFAVGWFELEARAKTLENAQLTAELQLLKAQINPHFLFNTLNNLQYLAYMQSPHTPEGIARLGQMMRYMIYDSNHPEVALSEELEYMQNYISLEQLRLNNPNAIAFEVAGPVAAQQIAPLILVSFLENAFKHGLATHGNGWVRVRVELEGSRCDYTVTNSRPATLSPPKKYSGAGLQNVRRRLALSYPGRHSLQIDELPEEYRVHLRLALS